MLPANQYMHRPVAISWGRPPLTKVSQVLEDNTCEISQVQLVNNGTGVQGWGQKNLEFQ